MITKRITVIFTILLLSFSALANVEQYDCVKASRVKPKSNDDQDERFQNTKVVISGDRLHLTTVGRESKLLFAVNLEGGRKIYSRNNGNEIAIKVSTADDVSFVLTPSKDEVDKRLWHFAGCTEQ